MPPRASLPQASLVRRCVFFLPLLLTLGLPALAASPVDLNNLQRQNDVLLRQQQEQLHQDQEDSQHNPAPNGADLSTPATPTASAAGPCRQINTIVISGASHLKPARQRALKQPYLGRCLAAGDIQALLTQITGEYFRRGHVTSRAYLPPQDLSQGQLSITVVEGVISSLAVDGNGRDRTWLSGAFPGLQGQLLNLRDLEQGIDQLNHQAANNAHLDIEPGQQPGESIVVIHNAPTLPYHLLSSLDNEGSTSTGRRSATTTATEDGRLGLNEVVSVTRRQSIPDSDSRFSESNALDAWLPLGYNTLSFDVSSSAYVTEIPTPSGLPLLSQGNTLSRSLGLDRVVFRNQSSRVTVSGTLDTQTTDSYLANQLLDVSSRHLTYFDAAAAWYTGFWGGLFNARYDEFRGLRKLGALEDPTGLDHDVPHAQFRKRTLSLGYDRPFALLGQQLRWSSQLNAQLGVTTLFGAQQMLIGGVNSVRGFLNTTLSGDSGYYWRNDLSLLHSCSIGRLAMNCRYYTGLDFGSVTNNSAGVPSGALSGMALGTSAQWRQLTGELFLTHALMVPDGMTHEGTLAFFRLSLSL